MSADIPVVVTSAGAQPTPPAQLLAALLTSVSKVVPGYTASLPASLVEDVSSTEVGGLAVADSARVETINSITPYGANEFVLGQLGQIYIGPGSAPASPTNTSVLVVFQAVDADGDPIPGYVIPMGFTVGDGTYQYVVQDGGATGVDGFTDALFCQAPNAGTWAVPPNTVSQIVTSAPTGVVLSCTNQVSGVSGGPAETAEQYRARVIQAGQAIVQGAPTMLKTRLALVSGVQPRLISTQQQPGGGWEVVVGGGDPYKVAYAIYMGIGDVSSLEGSTLGVTNVTQANPGVVTTDLNHGYTTGQVAVIEGIVGMVPLNNVQFPVTVIDEKTFSIGIDTRGYPSYISGGVVTPNLRNVSVSINDYPDVYSVPFVNPPQQVVVVTLLWNTTSQNFVSDAAMAQLGNPALVSYVNSVQVGAPLNLFVMETAFQEAVASVLDPNLLTRMSFSISINGIGVAPVSGTGEILGDPSSYFQTSSSQVVILRG